MQVTLIDETGKLVGTALLYVPESEPPWALTLDAQPGFVFLRQPSAQVSLVYRRVQPFRIEALEAS